MLLQPGPGDAGAGEQAAGAEPAVAHAGRVAGEVAEFPFGLGAHASAVISGHRDLRDAGVGGARDGAGRGGGGALARTVLAARRAP